MNDRLKFRAWDKKNKKIVKNIGFYQDKIIYPEWALEDIKYFEIMQYTGLKDRKGKMIYEGDILKNDWNHNQFVVEWGEGEYPHQSDADSNKNKFNYKYGGCEVIGNVWEHPELIKK